MGWDDWDDDEPQPRRRRRDPFDVRDGRPEQSGAVTGAGVVTIVVSVLFLLCGGGLGVCGLFCTSAGAAARQQGGFLPPQLFERLGGIMLGWSLFHLLLAVGMLMAGIVTLQRRNWGRVMTLILAGIVGALGGVQFIVAILIGVSDGGGLFGNNDPEDRIVQAVVFCISALLYVAYTIFVFIVLLNSHNRAEFD
ncbi:MAG: hypothetical protein L0Y71_09370 [Gemmataceae bacterium]|nr:hypothetical protein [Gemmataceae bacterium]